MKNSDRRVLRCKIACLMLALICASAGQSRTASRIGSGAAPVAGLRQVIFCLSRLCETGASNASVDLAREVAANLERESQTRHTPYGALLDRVLSFRHGFGQCPGSVPGAPGIPSDIVRRAAAACYLRGHTQPGEIVLSFAGDCTFGTVNGDGADIRFPTLYARSGRVDYPFALIKPWFVNDDLTAVNFECTLTDAVKTADKQWKFKGPARYAAIFPAGSVEVVGLANNHSMDYRQAGFDDTVANFRRAHIPAFYQNTPYITTIKGVQVVLIGDCTVVGENTTRIDGAPARVVQEIHRYKRPDNVIVVVMHWGSELDTVPISWQQAMGRHFIDAGADAVVGAHPHVLQGIEVYHGKYIAYSLGNFAFGGNSLARHPETIVLRLGFRVQHGITGMAGASVVPCLTTSSRTRTSAGFLVNNYQPEPVFGEQADRIAGLVLQRSAGLKYGVKLLDYLR